MAGICETVNKQELVWNRILQLACTWTLFQSVDDGLRLTWPRGYKTFFKLSSAEHENSGSKLTN